MRSIPPITKNLLIINALFFAATWVLQESRGIDLEQIFGLHYVLAEDFRPWQFVTYMFMHGNIMHLFFNMFALWMFGGLIERTLETKRFLIFYFACGIGAGFCQEIAQYIHTLSLDMADVSGTYVYSAIETIGRQTYFTTPVIPTEPVSAVLLGESPYPLMSSVYFNLWNCVGASGCVYGILLAFAMYYPNERMFIIPIPFPIKAKYLVLGYAVIELMDVLTSVNDGVAHIAHLGGMLFGLALILIWRKMDNRRRGGAQYVSFDSYTRRF